jgi:hypothetical protein
MTIDEDRPSLQTLFAIVPNRRLHLSTWLILLMTAVMLAIIVVPGEVDDHYYTRDFRLQEHGWPWVHLRRFVPKPEWTSAIREAEGYATAQQRLALFRKEGNPLPLLPVPRGRFWTDPEHWTFWRGLHAWNATACIGNAMACLVILLGVGGLAEYRRRRRNAFWQISLRETIASMVVFAVVLIVGVGAFRQVQREARARATLMDPLATKFKIRDVAPNWLRKLTDNSRFLQVPIDGHGQIPLGWRVYGVEFHDFGNLLREDPGACIKSLSDFSHLNSLGHWQSGPVSLKFFADAPTQQIRRIDLFGTQFCSDYRFLGRFQNLEKLCLIGIDLQKVKFEYPVLAKLEEISMDDRLISPRTIEWLRAQPGLRRIRPWTSGVISEELQHQLQDALPGVSILPSR